MRHCLAIFAKSARVNFASGWVFRGFAVKSVRAHHDHDRERIRIRLQTAARFTEGSGEGFPPRSRTRCVAPLRGHTETLPSSSPPSQWSLSESTLSSRGCPRPRQEAAPKKSAPGAPRLPRPQESAPKKTVVRKAPVKKSSGSGAHRLAPTSQVVWYVSCVLRHTRASRRGIIMSPPRTRSTILSVTCG